MKLSNISLNLIKKFNQINSNSIKNYFISLGSESCSSFVAQLKTHFAKFSFYFFPHALSMQSESIKIIRFFYYFTMSSFLTTFSFAYSAVRDGRLFIGIAENFCNKTRKNSSRHDGFQCEAGVAKETQD